MNMNSATVMGEIFLDFGKTLEGSMSPTTWLPLVSYDHSELVSSVYILRSIGCARKVREVGTRGSFGAAEGTGGSGAWELDGVMETEGVEEGRGDSEGSGESEGETVAGGWTPPTLDVDD